MWQADPRDEGPADSTAELNTAKDTLLEFPALPDSAFHYPYFLFVPQSSHTGTAVRLLVVPNNTGKADDDLAVHREAARTLALEGAGLLAKRLGTPLLVPVFPRPRSHWRIYTHALDRDAMRVQEGPLRRIDLQLLAMIRHARGRLRESGMPVKERVFMKGFSASGNFTNRFAVLHPHQVRAVASGGVNGLPILPVPDLEGQELPYPIGVGDLEKVAGAPFDLAAYGTVSQFIYMGELDRNDTYPYDDAWNDDERALIKEVVGRVMMPVRWERSQEILRAQALPIQCVTYAGTAHSIRPEMLEDIVRFLQSNDGPEHQEIAPHEYVVSHERIEQAHVNGLYWRGDQRIPESWRNLGRMDFLIRVEEWLDDQDYSQLNTFFENAEFDFELRATGAEPVRITRKNHWGSASQGDGSFQGFVIKLDAGQRDRIIAGKEYRLHPMDPAGSSSWIVRDGVVLVRLE